MPGQEWKSPGRWLVILCGRRRIGKTRLIDEFIQDKPVILSIAEDAGPGRSPGIRDPQIRYPKDTPMSQTHTVPIPSVRGIASSNEKPDWKNPR